MSLLRLYPAPSAPCRLQGLYLDLGLHRRAATGATLIYTNFIASLDGRIALYDAASGDFGVPLAIANGRDWRLYQELAAQADVLIVSGRYFRQLAQGRAQAILPLGMEPEYADLHAWRRQQGLKEQPDILVLSDSLDLPAEALARFAGRRILVLTGSRPSREKRERLERHGVELLSGEGGEEVDGTLIRQTLIEHSYRSAYAIAGPMLFRTLVAGRMLDFLFLTSHFSLLGGEGFRALLEGDIDSLVRLELVSVYLDEQPETPQLFACYALQSD